MLKTTVHKLNVTVRLCNQTNYNIGNNLLNVQSVRWRKPLSLGTAKSKMFRVPERRKQDPEERAEMFRLHSNYKTVIRSLEEHFKEENRLRNELLSQKSKSAEDELDFEKISSINDEWNARIAVLRTKRLKKESVERKEFILSRLVAKEERELEIQQRIDERVRQEKEASKMYILPENIDQVIENALTNIVDYNFAIDLNGNIYRGRDTEAIPPQEEHDDNKKKLFNQ